jgi:cysteine desulfurase/selenocysteine lyase
MTDTPSALTAPADAREQLRQQMPATKHWAYFDHAAVAPLTAPAAAAICGWAQEAAEQGDVPWPAWAKAVEALRRNSAQFLGADESEIALIHNTTHGIGLVAEGFPWQPGDNVVVPDNEFPSNLLPWSLLKGRGVELRKVPVGPSGEMELSRLHSVMDRRTRIVSVSWVGFASGYRLDVAEVAEVVHQAGALLMLDAIQGLGAFRLDVRASGVDFLAADGHKWMLGPEGAGLFYIRQEHLDLLRPVGVGWGSLATAGFDPNSQALKQSAARYEGGSTNMPGMLGLAQSFRLLSQLHGPQGSSSPLSDAILENVQLLCDRLRRLDFNVHLPRHTDHRSGIIGIDWKDTPFDESLALAARKSCLAAGVALSVRSGRLRVSTHAYNDEQDIDRLAEALVRFRKQL